MLAFANILQKFLISLGVSSAHVGFLSAVTSVACILLVMYLSYVILSRVIEPIIDKITYRTEVKWDDIVFRHKALRWIWILVPLLIGQLTMPKVLVQYHTAQDIFNVMLQISLVLTIMMIVIESIKSIFLLIGDHENIREIAEQMHQAQEAGEEFVYHPSHSLKGLQQMLSVIVIGFSIILCFSILFGKNPVIVFSGLGAAAAVLMLVFQDSILGVVAGVQLTANDMLQPGDWIMSPKYQANGIVQEVTLAAVKVRNWDQTIVTVPPYKLLTEGFQNWRGMQISKGRRVCRSINIDLLTVKWATEDQVENWSAQKWWHQNALGTDGRITNLSAFRMYLEYFITTLPTIKANMLYMIRELQPTPEGLPLEIYFFTSRTDWKGYEMVQADAFDRIIADVPTFGLRLYQRPSGVDVRCAGNVDNF